MLWRIAAQDPVPKLRGDFEKAPETNGWNFASRRCAIRGGAVEIGHRASLRNAIKASRVATTLSRSLGLGHCSFSVGSSRFLSLIYDPIFGVNPTCGGIPFCGRPNSDDAGRDETMP